MILHDKEPHPDCKILKDELFELVPSARRQNTAVRIVMPELEAWYLSDPTALFEANIISESDATPMRLRRKFRNPEKLNNARQEFLRLCNPRGFFGQRLLATKVSPFLDPIRSSSTSLKVVIKSLTS